VVTPTGGFSDDVPIAYQEVGGERVDILLSYKLAESGGARRTGNYPEIGAEPGEFAYGFEVGDYDHSLPVVLDPAILAYCGYIGGSSADYGIA
jgi:hypothetical protein